LVRCCWLLVRVEGISIAVLATYSLLSLSQNQPAFIILLLHQQSTNNPMARMITTLLHRSLVVRPVPLMARSGRSLLSTSSSSSCINQTFTVTPSSTATLHRSDDDGDAETPAPRAMTVFPIAMGVSAFGDNSSGQHGLGHKLTVHQPILLPLQPPCTGSSTPPSSMPLHRLLQHTAIGAGDAFSLVCGSIPALLDQQQPNQRPYSSSEQYWVWGCGSNTHGQLGRLPTPTVHKPDTRAERDPIPSFAKLSTSNARNDDDEPELFVAVSIPERIQAISCGRFHSLLLAGMCMCLS
jgi:hypothetical protein